MVVFEIGKMDSRSGHLDSRIDHRFMDMVAIHPLAAESRDERRVDIDDTPAVFLREKVQRHETSQDNQVHRVLVEVQIDSQAEFAMAGKFFSGEHQAGDPGFTGFFDPPDPCPAG